MPTKILRALSVTSALVILATALAACTSEHVSSPETSPNIPSARPTPSSTPSATPTVPQFNRSALSIDDPTSLWVIVDKLRPLVPADFVPPDLVDTPVPHLNPPGLRAEAASAMVAMFAAARAEGAGGMQLQSAYRSYATQVTVYHRYVASAGKAAADRQSARPGFSEHQSGLAADISAVPLTCALSACFGQTPQGMWLVGNAYRFGFLLRYPADKVAVTGYMYEPWHFRYVGVSLATEMHAEGVTTLEEFFGLPAAPDYAP